jgi:hypothetical protein
VTDISTKSRSPLLVGIERIPIQAADGSYMYSMPADMGQVAARLGSFSKWNTAKARGASSPPRVLFTGDSNVMGQGANSGTTLFAKGFARDFAEQMGWLVGSVFGSQVRATDNKANYIAYNPEVSMSGGWDVNNPSGPGDTIGGRMFKSLSTTGGSFTIASAAVFDKLRFWGPRTSGLNTSMTITVDGNLEDSFSEAGAAGLIMRDVDGLSLSTHTVAIGCSGSGDAYVLGIEFWDTTNGMPVYIQDGYWGGKAAEFINSTSAWSKLNHYPTFAADYAFYYCTINDSNSTATALQTYYGNVETYVKAMSAAGADGCLCVGFPASNDSSRNGYLDNQAEILKKIARDYNWSYLDFRKVLGGHSYNRVNDLGLAYDTHHPNQAGHDLMADFMYSLFSQVM